MKSVFRKAAMGIAAAINLIALAGIVFSGPWKLYAVMMLCFDAGVALLYIANTRTLSRWARMFSVVLGALLVSVPVAVLLAIAAIALAVNAGDGIMVG